MPAVEFLTERFKTSVIFISSVVTDVIGDTKAGDIESNVGHDLLDQC